jgi:hypothetical protein
MTFSDHVIPVRSARMFGLQLRNAFEASVVEIIVTDTAWDVAGSLKILKKLRSTRWMHSIHITRSIGPGASHFGNFPSKKNKDSAPFFNAKC